MKKTNLLSILAVSSLLVAGIALANNERQMKSASAAGIDELAPWGECEEDFTDSITGSVFTASAEEHLLGAKSWKLDASEKQVRLNISPNGSIYEGGAYFKGAAGVTVNLIGIVIYQDAASAWQYGYFDTFPALTLTGGWDELRIAFSCKQEGGDILMDKNGDGQYEDPAKLTGTFAAVNMLFRISAAPVYMDHFDYHVKGDIPAGSLQGEGSAENTGFGESWSPYARSYEESYKGGHSYKAANNTRARLNTPMADGTLYEGSLKVKGEANTTFNLVGIFTCQDTGGGWIYGYLDAYTAITLTGGWDDFSFKFSLLADTDAHTLEIRRTGETMVSGDPTLASFAGVGGFDLDVRTSSAAVYMDEFYIVAKQSQGPEIDYTDAVVHYTFDESIAPFAAVGEGSAAQTTEANEVYRGAGALKIKGVWTRHTDTACEWIQQGDFLEFSAFVKNLAAAPASAAYVQLQTWSCSGEDPAEGWAATNTRIDLIHYNNGATSDSFKLLKGKFGIYSDGSESYIYHNGQLVDAEFPAGNVVAPQILFDIGATAPDFLAYDDVAIMKTTVKKDSVLTISGLQNPSVKVFKGTEEIADAVVEASGNTLTVKNLEYGNFKDKYVLKIYDGADLVGQKEVSFVHSDASYSPAYTGTVTVNDVQGQPITDATISYQGGQVTANVNGVYTISGIEGDLAVKVEKEGYISVNATLSISNKDIVVTLRQPKPVTDYEDNLLPKNAGVEDGWTFAPNKQGLDYVVTDEDQYEGAQSLKISATKDAAQTLFRVQDAPNYSGKTYRLEAMVKAAEGTTAHFTMGGVFTCQSRSGWAYGWAIPEVQEVSDQWQLVSMTFRYDFDPLEGTLSVSINGGEATFIEEIVSVAAYDFTLKLGTDGEVAYVDDFAMYEVFDPKVNVIGADGNPIKNATFQLTDPRGKQSTPNIAYNEQEGGYIFQGLYGAQMLVASAGGKTYDPVKATKAIAAIEESYTINLTLKDQNGDVVTGATVIARKGISTVGTFTEVGNGVYTLEGVMGEVTIVVTKENYEFEKQNVNASNATLTIVGVNNGAVTPEEPEDKPAKKGCGSSILVGGVLISTISLLGLGLLLSKKRRD